MAPPGAPPSPALARRPEIPEGLRLLLGERIRGQVAVIDVPAAHDGRVYLVERAVTSLAELEGVVEEYRARSEAARTGGPVRGRPGPGIPAAAASGSGPSPANGPLPGALREHEAVD